MNALKKNLCASAGWLAFTLTAVAGDITVTLTPSAVSQYMFRGVRLGGPAFQPAVEIASGNFGVGVWTTIPISGRVPGQSDPEIDPYAYYTVTVNDKVSVVPGFAWYNYPRADQNAGFYKSSVEPYLTLNYTVEAVTLSPKIYYDMMLKGPSYELTVAWSVPLEQQKTSLNFAAVVGTYTWKESINGASPAVKNRGDYYQIGVTTPFQVNAKTKLTLGLAYTKGSNNRFESAGFPAVDNTAAVGRFVASLSCAFSF